LTENTDKSVLEKQDELSEEAEPVEGEQAAEENTEQTAEQNVEQNAEEAEYSEIKALEQALQAKTALADEYLRRLQRLQADFDNYRKRVQREKDQLREYATEELMLNLLPVIDNLERAIALETTNGQQNNILEGIRMIYRQLIGTLENAGLVCIDALGKPFDPELHEAVMRVETDEYPENTVVEELQKGYRLHKKVIRPAMVKVAQ